MEQTCLSVALRTLFHVEITAGQARGDRNPSYPALPLLFVLYLISISVIGDRVKEEDNKEQRSVIKCQTGTVQKENKESIAALGTINLIFKYFKQLSHNDGSLGET